MENAVEGLKMAGSVLLFVIALSVAILAFTQSREAIDAILKYSDREYLTIQNDSRFYYLKSNDTQRYVGKETIIPAIYRAYKENYKIIFEFNNTNQYLYQKVVNGSVESINTIDLLEETFGNESDVQEFLNGIIYKKFNGTEEQFRNKFSVYGFPTKCLFDYIDSHNKIKEKLGTYYIEDLKQSISDTSTESDIDDVNKNEKRVITYKFEN